MKSKMMIMLVCPFLVSCLKIKDADKANKDPAAAPAPEIQLETQAKAPLIEEEFLIQPTAQVTSLDQPQQYAVLIKGLEGVTQVTRKSAGLDQSNTMQNVPIAEGETGEGPIAEDVIGSAGDYEYIVHHNRKTFFLSVSIPQDIVIRGDIGGGQIPIKDKKFKGQDYRILETTGRIYFSRGSRLTTNGENFIFQASSIESDGATLQTFPENQKAGIAQPGRHGGHIILKAESIRGTLEVNMRGENGGEPENYNPRKDPSELKNQGQSGGNSGFLEVDIAKQDRGSVTYKLEFGQGTESVAISRTFCPFIGTRTGEGRKNCQTRHIKPAGQNGSDGILEQPIGIK